MASTWPINYEHSSTNENLVSQVHGPKTRSQCKALCKQDLTADSVDRSGYLHDFIGRRNPRARHWLSLLLLAST